MPAAARPARLVYAQPTPGAFTCALRAGGRRGDNDTRWELEPTAADTPLAVLVVKMHQQFESPPAVVATVRRRWQPTFDAMATPFSGAMSQSIVWQIDGVPHSIVWLSRIYRSSAALAGRGKKRNETGGFAFASYSLVVAKLSSPICKTTPCAHATRVHIATNF